MRNRQLRVGLCACLWRTVFVNQCEAIQPTVGVTIPYAGGPGLWTNQAEHRLSSGMHTLFIPFCGCNVTGCLKFLLPETSL